MSFPPRDNPLYRCHGFFVEKSRLVYYNRSPVPEDRSGSRTAEQGRAGCFEGYKRSAVSHLMESVIIVKIVVFGTLLAAVALYHYLYR